MVSLSPGCPDKPHRLKLGHDGYKRLAEVVISQACLLALFILALAAQGGEGNVQVVQVNQAAAFKVESVQQRRRFRAVFWATGAVQVCLWVLQRELQLGASLWLQ